MTNGSYCSNEAVDDQIVCTLCGAAVWEFGRDRHDEWHRAVEDAFKAQAREFHRLVDVVCGKPPRSPYRRPRSDEEREQMAEVLRELGINVD